MADNGDASNNRRGIRAAVITVLVILLLVVTVVVLQMIQRQRVAGPAGPAGPGEGAAQMPPAAVIVTPVAREKTREYAVVTGMLRARSQAEVAAREPGAVDQLPVDEGDVVAGGDVLAVLDGRRLRAQREEVRARVTAAESLLAQRKAELDRAGQDLEMKRRLAPSRAISRSDLLDAEKALSVARAQVRAATDGIAEARSRLELIEVQMADLTVKAPFAGTVVARHVEPGEWLAAGAKVVSLVALDPIEAWLRVPARFLGAAALEPEGFKIRQSATGREFAPRRVIRIPEVDARSQLFTVVATLANADRRLSPGESVTGIVPLGEPADYLRVPVDAVVHSPQGTIVQVVQPAEGEGLPTARAVPVRIAFEREGQVFIAAEGAGFNEGDQVVVEGNQRLMPGQSLMIKTADAPAGPPAP